MDIKLINLKTVKDREGRGYLTYIESIKDIPFEIKRIYYIYGTKKDKPRGFHAHKTLKQIAICLKGKCKIILDNGKEKAKVVLDRPDIGLIIEEMIWREMYFEDDTILLVLANDYYDEDDYIRDYHEFIECVHRQNGNS